ncbi:hypothetical protein Tco_0967299 [Tanacetum coccineum]
MTYEDKESLMTSVAEKIQADCDLKATNIFLLRSSPEFQVNTKFLNSLPPKWSKFVTDVKLARDSHTTNYDQLQQYAPQKSIEDIREIKMEHARKQQVLKETITSFDTTALEEFDQKTTLFETMTKSKSFNKSPKQRALYHALMQSILEDEDAMDEGVADKLKKRKPDDADKDEGPSAGSDRGLKRRKTSKDTEPSKKAKSTETSKGTSKSQPKTTGKSAQAEETVFEVEDTQGLHNLGEDTGNTNEPPIVDVDLKDWFKKPKRPPTPDPEWNKGKSVENKPTQKWLSDLAKAEKPSRTFDDLMSTLINFSAFVMNRLHISKLTQDILVGLAYNILKGTCRSYVELDYNMEECYKALTDQLDWNNPEGDRYPFDLSKPLPLALHIGDPKDRFYGYASKRVSKHDVYSTKRILVVTNVKVKKGKMHYVCSQDVSRSRRVEDLQLGGESYQKKLNISRPMIHKAGIIDLKPYSAYSNP